MRNSTNVVVDCAQSSVYSYFYSLNVRIESRENRTPNKSTFSSDVYSLSILLARFARKPQPLPPPRPPNSAYVVLALLAFSFVCVNSEALNSLRSWLLVGASGHF